MGKIERRLRRKVLEDPGPKPPAPPPSSRGAPNGDSEVIAERRVTVTEAPKDRQDETSGATAAPSGAGEEPGVECPLARNPSSRGGRERALPAARTPNCGKLPGRGSSGGRCWKTRAQGYQYRPHPRGEPQTEQGKSQQRNNERSQKRRGTSRTRTQEPWQNSRWQGKNREREHPLARAPSSKGGRERVHPSARTPNHGKLPGSGGSGER